MNSFRAVCSKTKTIRFHIHTPRDLNGFNETQQFVVFFQTIILFYVRWTITRSGRKVVYVLRRCVK